MPLQCQTPSRTLLGAAAGALLLASAGASAEGDYLLATASTGGTYYPVGVALSTLVKVKLQPTNGINVRHQFGRLRREHQTDAGQRDPVRDPAGPLRRLCLERYRRDGEGRPADRLRSVTMLWQNVEHFLVKAEYAKTGTIGRSWASEGSGAGFGKNNSGSWAPAAGTSSPIWVSISTSSSSSSTAATVPRPTPCRTARPTLSVRRRVCRSAP